MTPLLFPVDIPTKSTTGTLEWNAYSNKKKEEYIRERIYVHYFAAVDQQRRNDVSHVKSHWRIAWANGNKETDKCTSCVYIRYMFKHMQCCYRWIPSMTAVVIVYTKYIDCRLFLFFFHPSMRHKTALWLSCNAAVRMLWHCLVRSQTVIRHDTDRHRWTRSAATHAQYTHTHFYLFFGCKFLFISSS